MGILHKSHIICVGFINLEDIEYPGKETQLSVPGGAALYSACAAKIWQPQVTLISAIGRNFPEKHIDLLKSKNINLLIVKHEEVKTMSGITRYFPDGSREYKMFSPVEDRIVLTPRVFQFKNNFIKNIGNFCVHLSTIPPEFQLEWAQYFRSLGAKIISFDTDISFVMNNRSLLAQLMPLTDICFMNFEEASAFVNGEQNYYSIASEISKYGCSIVIIKLGKEGAFIYNKKTSLYFHVSAFPTTVIDVTGAGDSFAGTFLGLFSGGEEIKMSAKLASATASSCIEEYGAIHLLDKTNDQIIEKIKLMENK